MSPQSLARAGRISQRGAGNHLRTVASAHSPPPARPRELRYPHAERASNVRLPCRGSPRWVPRGCTAGWPSPAGAAGMPTQRSTPGAAVSRATRSGHVPRQQRPGQEQRHRPGRVHVRQVGLGRQHRIAAREPDADTAPVGSGVRAGQLSSGEHEHHDERSREAREQDGEEPPTVAQEREPLIRDGHGGTVHPVRCGEWATPVPQCRRHGSGCYAGGGCPTGAADSQSGQFARRRSRTPAWRTHSERGRFHPPGVITFRTTPVITMSACRRCGTCRIHRRRRPCCLGSSR